MANTLQALVPKILTEALLIFRNNSITANLVNRNYDGLFKKKGDTIDIPLLNAGVVQDITSGRGNENTPSDIKSTTIPVTLDKWKEVKFQLSDLELKKIEDGRPSEMLINQVIALADYVDSWLLDEIQVGSYQYAGTIGTPLDTNGFIEGRGLLSKSNVPKTSRNAIINVDTSGTLLKEQKISEVDKAGTSEALRDARISRLYGFDMYESNNLANFVGGTLSNGTSKQANTQTALTGGETTITLTDTTLTGTLKRGDIFSIAGKTGSYVVTADAVASGNQITINISPAIRSSVTAGTQVSFLDNHTNDGLLFHESAFVFGSAPLKPQHDGGNIISSLTDPLSGISLTYEVERVNKSTEHSLSILYGGKVIRAEGICRLVE